MILDFIGAKDAGGGGDNWRHKTCKATVKSSPAANQHPAFYRPDAFPVAQQCQSTEGKTNYKRIYRTKCYNLPHTSMGLELSRPSNCVRTGYESPVWQIMAAVCLLTAPQVQMSMDNLWAHNALQYNQVMIYFHFQYRKALEKTGKQNNRTQSNAPQNTHKRKLKIKQRTQTAWFNSFSFHDMWPVNGSGLTFDARPHGQQSTGRTSCHNMPPPVTLTFRL